MTRKRLVIWFVAVLALSLYSRWSAFHALTDRCRLDGNRLIPVYRVDLMLEGQVRESFCCLRCASEWPNVPAGSYWQVRDEITGQVLDASRGRFVESSVVTIPSRQEHTHVFKDWADAMNHMAEYGGRRVVNPLPVASQGGIMEAGDKGGGSDDFPTEDQSDE